MAQYAKNGRKRSDLWDPTLGFHDVPAKDVSQTL